MRERFVTCLSIAIALSTVAIARQSTFANDPADMPASASTPADTPASAKAPADKPAAAKAPADTSASATTTADRSTWSAPRTPDGHPDLQGVWANNNVTPLDR